MIASGTGPDYTAITELPGTELTAEQWARIHHRYALAVNLAQERRVLEVACGSGVGLPSLARRAVQVVAGDYTATVLATAQATTQAATQDCATQHCATQHCAAPCSTTPHGATPRHSTRPDSTPTLAQFHAQQIPFADNSFDLLLMFEAIYYLDAPSEFLREARRVLAPCGQILLSTENPAWPDFVPGKLSTRYWHIPELYGMLRTHGFTRVGCYGAFPVSTYSLRRKLLARARRLLVRYGFVPQQPGLRRLIQRLGYGALRALPTQLDPTQMQAAPLTPLVADRLHPEYKVYFLHATV